MAEKPLISYDIANCLSSKIGPELGLTREVFANEKERMANALKQIQLWKDARVHGFIDLPLNKDQIATVENALDQLPSEIDTILHIGIGGSSLGPLAIQQALDNELTEKLPTRFSNVVVQENVDPEGFAIRFNQLDLKKTAINVVSKSGGTIETLACLAAAMRRMKEHFRDDELGKRMIVCTENMDGALAKIGHKYGALIIALPNNVDGRFSVLTAVGLLPARAMGINIEELLDGAAAMREQCLTAAGTDDPCFLSAFIPYYLNAKGVNIHVIFPYSELLRGFSLWCCQLLGESLGKRIDRNDNVVNVGQTPTPSVGSVDQHSLLQLYMEGPKDKFFTFLKIENFRSEEDLSNIDHPKLEEQHTSGLTMGTVINAEMKGTANALATEGRPSVTINIPKLTPHTLGQLFYFFEFGTAYAAEFYNINAFDQPGVEASKILTFKYLRGES